MAPDIEPEDNGPPNGSYPDTTAAEAALKARLSRKRTKTGCLTCRKRRIKCGEERPVCKNCVKSKRHCEGYNQRVIFKQPAFDYQPVANGGAHITFHAGPVHDGISQPEVQVPGGDPSTYTQLRPRPAEHQLVTVYDTFTQQYVKIPAPALQQVHHGQHPTPTFSRERPPQPVISPGHNISDAFQTQQIVSGPQRYAPPNFHSPASAFAFQAQQAGPFPAIGPQMHAHMSTNGHVSTPVTLPGEYLSQAYAPPVTDGSPQRLPIDTFEEPAALFHHPWIDTNVARAHGHDMVGSTPLSGQSSRTVSLSQTPQTLQQQWSPNSYVPRLELSHPIDFQPPTHHPQHPPMHIHSAHVQPNHVHTHHFTPGQYEHRVHAPANPIPAHVLKDAAVEVQDDDYYDIESDEEQDIDTSPIPENSYKRQRTLSKILDRNQISIGDSQIRKYDTFLYDGILEKYRVEHVANPLKNEATARVFAHFISATGPSLSIFERHPRNTSVLFNDGAVPLSQQGLWTYTLPMAALHHQGLLHAMLALASLHIARIQGASSTPSMQHYAWSLRRIHAAVSNPESRLKLTTIAASMLLGFYEIMTADHMKWNMHLAGAKQLFVETDFVKMTQEFRRLKAERTAKLHLGRKRRYSSEEPFSQDALLDQIPDINERLVSEMVGREVRYDGQGRVELPASSIPPGLDLTKFEMLKDLYWWYCKQDVYQSIVSGNELLMDFNQWADCPPRAPLGKSDAVYGSFDHLILLLGRIADFAARDRKRKLKQIEANGGSWKPAPGMNIPRPPQAGPPSTPASATNFQFLGAQFPPPAPPPPPPPPPTMPEFYGMAPPPSSNVQMPASYAQFSAHPLPSPHTAYPLDPFDADLGAATQAALGEYGRIRAALRTFEMNLGEAFLPLTEMEQAPIYTAFGTAKLYRSYDMGCLWAIYNMAQIIAIRSHPHMPPAAHMAAGVAAAETKPYAIEIGRIVAGIVPGHPDTPLNPSLGAALCESCMPSFFAAVQYQDPHQRRETVTRLYNIAQRTGWGSVELIANGCETAWVKAAALNPPRGPPYTRVVRPGYPALDPRLNGSWEALDPNAKPNENDDSDRRLVKTNPNARLNWAIGIIGVEADVEKMDIRA